MSCLRPADRSTRAGYRGRGGRACESVPARSSRAGAGAGVVGGGVYEILASRRSDFLAIGADVVIKSICVRDVNKPRDFDISSETKAS